MTFSSRIVVMETEPSSLSIIASKAAAMFKFWALLCKSKNDSLGALVLITSPPVRLSMTDDPDLLADVGGVVVVGFDGVDMLKIRSSNYGNDEKRIMETTKRPPAASAPSNFFVVVQTLAVGIRSTRRYSTGRRMQCRWWHRHRRIGGRRGRHVMCWFLFGAKIRPARKSQKEDAQRVLDFPYQWHHCCYKRCRDTIVARAGGRYGEIEWWHSARRKKRKFGDRFSLAIFFHWPFW